ncbi:Glutaredoxin [Ostertagia ostertagi]
MPATNETIDEATRPHEKLHIGTRGLKHRPNRGTSYSRPLFHVTFTMIAVLWEHLAPYGWLLTFSCVLAYFIYNNVIKPKLKSIWESKELIEKKKFDEDVHARVAARLEAAREAQQRHHDAVAEEVKRSAEEAARKKLELIEEELRKRNVLETTLISRDLNLKKKVTKVDQPQSPDEIIDAYISSKPVVVFSKTWCPFCRKAKAALATLRLRKEQFEYIELDERPDLPMDAIQDEFQKRYGSRSVPKVFIGGQFIGGGDDTARLLHTGELERLVQAALNSQ